MPIMSLGHSGKVQDVVAKGTLTLQGAEADAAQIATVRLPLRLGLLFGFLFLFFTNVM